MVSSCDMDTLLHRLHQWKIEAPNAPAHKWKQDGTWVSISAQELHSRVEALARYLISEGMRAGDIGLIYAYNSSAWVQMDLAFMLTRGSSAGIYVNASVRQIHYIINHSEAKFLVVDRISDTEKIFQGREPSELFPNLRKIIVIRESENLPAWAIHIDEAVERGRRIPSPSFEELVAKLMPDDRAALIYTSGTTGQPKGVCLSHANMTYAASSYSLWNPPKHGQLFSFLPLAHVAERTVALGMGLTNRYAVYFCSSPMAIAQELREVQPTVVLCVPRLWDKLKEGFENRMRQMTEKDQKRIRWAMNVSRKYHSLSLRKKPISPLLRLQYMIADRFVLQKIRTQLGIGQAKKMASGAAALSPATLEWFRGIGVRLIEAYALSESSGLLTCGTTEEETAYTVGVPYPGIEMRLGEDGEIQTRGPHVFQGYFKDEAATAAILKDGWLHTGDIGTIDENGYLKIIGRKREIIKNAEGKMISPLFLEAQLEAHPLIDQAIIIGNERPHLIALLTLAESVRPTNPTTLTIEDPDIVSQIQEHIDMINRESAGHEKIKRFKILARPFSIEGDEMTATMKLKRLVIEKKYSDLIESLYERPRVIEMHS